MVPDVFVVPYEVPSEEFLADLLGTSLDGLFTDNARYLLDLLCVGISGNSDSMTWRGVRATVLLLFLNIPLF